MVTAAEAVQTAKGSSAHLQTKRLSEKLKSEEVKKTGYIVDKEMHTF